MGVVNRWISRSCYWEKVPWERRLWFCDTSITSSTKNTSVPCRYSSLSGLFCLMTTVVFFCSHISIFIITRKRGKNPTCSPPGMRKRGCTFCLSRLHVAYDLKNHCRAHFSLRGLNTDVNESQDLRSYFTKLHQICSQSNFSLTMLTHCIIDFMTMRYINPRFIIIIITTVRIAIHRRMRGVTSNISQT